MKLTGFLSVLLTLSIILTAFTCNGRQNSAQNGGDTAQTVVPSTETPDPNAPTVYFTSSITPEVL